MTIAVNPKLRSNIEDPTAMGYLFLQAIGQAMVRLAIVDQITRDQPIWYDEDQSICEVSKYIIISN
jgi:hypothetical protein